MSRVHRVAKNKARRARLRTVRKRLAIASALALTSAEHPVGDVFTHAQVRQAVRSLERLNAVLDEQSGADGFYYALVHPLHVRQAAMLEKRLRYPGGRKCARAVRRARPYALIGLVSLDAIDRARGLVWNPGSE